jgi:hypothetical protein
VALATYKAFRRADMHNNIAEKPPGLKYRLKNIMAGQWSRELVTSIARVMSRG